MLYSIAGRFGGFTEAEIWAMPLSRLRFWYRGHVVMREAEMKGKPKLDGE